MPEEVKTEPTVEEVVVEGEPTPVVDAPAETAPVEPEATPTTEEFYQTKYQDLKKSYDDATQKLDELGQNVFEPQSTETPAKKEETAYESTDEITMDKIEDMVMRASQQGYEKAEQRASVRQEFVGAQSVVNKFIKENNVPDEHLQRAVAFTKSLGINENAPGGAASLAKSVIAQLQYLALTERFNSNVTQAGATATVAAKTAQLVQQPDAGAMPQPGELTEEQKNIRDMMGLTNTSAKNELFDLGS